MPAVRLFLASSLLLFLEVALIRWMPAYIRLLAYFSNFILLAAFLGIGIGSLLARSRRTLFPWFPLIQAAVVATVYFVRLEVAIPSSSSIYFTSGTSERVVLVESTMLLPMLFVVVAVLFVTLAQLMARELETMPPLRAYAVNLLGSLAGVAAFAVISWLELGPTLWFALAFLLATPFVLRSRAPVAAANLALLAGSLVLVHQLAAGTLWSPYYKITTQQDNGETVVEVNNIFHQSMAPVAEKEYFYQWPYRVFGDRFENVLILGAGTGTDVAAALMHGAQRVDAVEIDPVIVRLGRELHPDRPYDDPRVNTITDDARHFLRVTDRKYDLVVFALIDSLTLQSSFSSVRLESYMFTEESFRAVRDRLAPDGVLVIYNYFREKWLVDRLANTATHVFGVEPRVHVHQEHTYLAVMMAGPGVERATSFPPPPDRVAAYNHPDVISPGRPLDRDAAVIPATDDWPFLYMRNPHIPSHYLGALALVAVVSVLAVLATLRGTPGGWSWHFFFLGAGFMLLQTKSIIQFALLWGSTWVVASLTIASVLAMALAATLTVSRVGIRRPWLVGAVLLALLFVSYLVPIGRLALDSLVLESIVYSVLVFSPIFCAGLLFGSSLKHSSTVARDYGANLLGAMLGGVTEYVALISGYQFLLLVVAGCYVAALVTRRRARMAVAVAA